MTTSTHISFCPEKCQPPMSDKSALALDSIQFNPGLNELTAEEFAELQAHPDYVKLLASGVLVLETVEMLPVMIPLLVPTTPTPTPTPGILQ